MRIKNKYKFYGLVIGLLFLIVISDTSKTVNAVDNYSEYLYNQEITVENDKAMLIRNLADGSNSYRNILESNFLFSSKIQNDMFSTQITDDFTRYSLNQLYFNNLDNEYAYGNSNPNENQIQDVELDNYDINKGSLVQDGNTSNYQHYNATYSFKSEVGKIGTQIDFVDDCSTPNNVRVINDIDSHKAVLNHSNIIPANDYIKNLIGSYKNNGTIEFWFRIDDLNTVKYANFLFREDVSTNIISLRVYNGYFQYRNSTVVWHNFLSATSDTWYHLKVNWYSNNKFSVYINNINYLYKIQTQTNIISGVDNFVSYVYQTNLYFDAINYNWSIPYYDNYYVDSDIIKNGILEPLTVILPNSDITKEWSSFYDGVPNTIHFRAVNESIASEHQYSSIYTNLANKIDRFEFTTYTISNNIQTIKIRLTMMRIVDISGGIISLRLYDGISYTTIQKITPINTNMNDYSVYFNVNYNQTQINNLEIEVKSDTFATSGTSFIYIINATLYYDTKMIDVEYENTFDFNYENPILYTLSYSFLVNISQIGNISIFNYDLNSYYLIDSRNRYLDYVLYSFILNESGYFRFNKIKIRIECLNVSNDYLLILDSLYLEITYVQQNYNGYQKLWIYNYRYESTSLKGYTLFELEIYQNYTRYKYSEINLFADDYLYDWITVNTSTYELKELEIQAHVRYGLNTLDQYIINFLYIIEFNYNESFKIEFREQTRKELTSNSIKSNINYTSYTCNYLNQTGIIGNYSYNCLSGFRSLYGANDLYFHRYFSIPYFNEGITLSKPSITLTETSGSMDEPTYPSSEYWTYETFRITNDYTYNYDYENWSIDYNIIKTQKYEAKYFYRSKSYDDDDFGSWKWKIKFSDIFSYTVDFNFMRNAVCMIINLILLFFQFVFFLFTASLSYIIMFIGCSIIVFIWNYPLLVLFASLVILLWYIFAGLIAMFEWLFDGLEYLFGWLIDLLWQFYLYVIIPFFDWFLNTGLPYLIEFIIIPIVAFILTLIIWILTFGSMDFATLYALIHDNLLLVSEVFIELIYEILNNIVAILGFFSLYIIMILLCFLKHIIVKARGFTNRSFALKESYEAYLYPIIMFYNLAIKIKNLLAQWF